MSMFIINQSESLALNQRRFDSNPTMQHNAEISALAWNLTQFCSDNFRKREALSNTGKKKLEFCNKQANSHQKAVKGFS